MVWVLIIECFLDISRSLENELRNVRSLNEEKQITSAIAKLNAKRRQIAYVLDSLLLINNHYGGLLIIFIFYFSSFEDRKTESGNFKAQLDVGLFLFYSFLVVWEWISLYYDY